MWLDNLKEMKARSKMTTKEIAAQSGIPEPTLEKLFSGATKDPKLTTMQQLVHFLGYTLDDLDDAPVSTKKAPPYTSEAMKLADDFDHQMDAWGQKAVRGVADIEIARCQEVQNTQTTTESLEPPKKTAKMPKAKKNGNMVEIKVYDQPAAAGLGNYLDDPDFHIEQYPEHVLPSGTDFGVRIDGDSMEPKIHNGYTVFVKAMPMIEPGQLGIFVLNGKSYCKKLVVDHSKRQTRLVSLNPKYEDIVIQEFDSLKTLGHVLGQWGFGSREDDFLDWIEK